MTRVAITVLKDILTGMGLGLGMQFDDQGNIIKGPDAP